MSMRGIILLRGMGTENYTLDFRKRRVCGLRKVCVTGWDALNGDVRSK